MQIQDAIRLMRGACALRHFSFNTEKTYVYWLTRYGCFLKQPNCKNLTTEEKMEAFLTSIATLGFSASSQNQAFNSLLFFYRMILKKNWGRSMPSAPNDPTPCATPPAPKR